MSAEQKSNFNSAYLSHRSESANLQQVKEYSFNHLMVEHLTSAWVHGLRTWLHLPDGHFRHVNKEE